MVYYKLLNGRGQTSLHNNNYEPGYFHSSHQDSGCWLVAFNTEPLHYVIKCLGHHPNPAENSPGFPARPSRQLCSGGIVDSVTFPRVGTGD